MRGFPLVDEYRLFYCNKRLIASAECDAPDSPLSEITIWDGIARRFASPFMSVDVARLETGGWTVIEVGDGGVSGLPLSIETGQFYEALRAATST